MPWPRKLGLLWLMLVLLVAVLAPVLPLPHAPGVPDLAHIAQPPGTGGHHWLGTDALGRDVLTELVYGARTAVMLTLPAALLATALGALMGGAAGFWGNRARLAVPYWLVAIGSGWWLLQLPLPLLGLAAGLVGAAWAWASRRQHGALPTWPIPIDAGVLGAATALDTIPRLVLVVAIAAGADVSIPGLLVLLAVTAWPHSARLVRAQMLRVRVLPFVEAARAAGIPAGRVWLIHALPHALQPIRTAFPLGLAGLLALESTLSFLGIGLPPNVASWGRLLATVHDEPSAWWVFIPALSSLSFSILSLIYLSRHRDDDIRPLGM